MNENMTTSVLIFSNGIVCYRYPTEQAALFTAAVAAWNNGETLEDSFEDVLRLFKCKAMVINPHEYIISMDGETEEADAIPL